MKKFTVHLTREYVVQINASNEEDARTFSERYVSGGSDESNEIIRKKNNFEIRQIKPTLNETYYVEEIEPS
jgi:hypothetical protein